MNGWNYSTRHSSVNGDFISSGTDREELALGISKKFSDWKTKYSRTYDLSNNKEEMIYETLGLEYNGSGYMFGNCLTILLEYKSSVGLVDRDLIPEDSIYLTFKFRTLGDYQWQP